VTKRWRARNPFCPEGADYCIRTPEGSVDWIGYATPTAEVQLRLALEAEGGRLRSIAEAAAIPVAYRARDRWESLDRKERIQLLRKTRAKIAYELKIPEYEVTSGQLARELMISEAKVKLYRWVI
jgi:hypothetical protein